MFGVVWAFAGSPWYLLAGILAVFVIVQMVSLTFYIQKTNKDLARFMEGMLTKDYTLHFNANKWGNGFNELADSFNKVGEVYRQARIEKEAQYQYFKNMVEQLDAGIISFNKEGKIAIMNQSAAKMLGIPVVQSVEILAKRLPGFTHFLQDLPPGVTELYELKDQTGGKQFKVFTSELQSGKELFKIVTFQNIHSEMEWKEMESWHKLIRVLTHEIMNSVTPITTLSETVNMILEEESGEVKPLNELDEEDLVDIHQSIQTIGKRSQGLLHFVADYRKLTKIAKPQKQEVVVQDLFFSLMTLYQKELREKRICISYEVIPSNLTVLIDQSLVEQVLINLILNATDALEGIEKAAIKLSAQHINDKTVIEVHDNGAGIPAHLQSQVFVPFYSTKEKGSGIGLSLSRNIINMHGGKLYFNSVQGSTSFFIEF